MDKMIGVLDPADIGSIMLWDHSAGPFQDGGQLRVRPYQVMKNLGLRAGESITGKVFDEGCPRLLDDPGEIAAALADMRAGEPAGFREVPGRDQLPAEGSWQFPFDGEPKGTASWSLKRWSRLPVHTGGHAFRSNPGGPDSLAIDRARLQTKADVIREASQAERLRSEVMAALSHQLRMPLSAIKGYATALLLEEVQWSEGKKAEFLRYIDEECDSMQSMITELLDSSLIDVGQLCIEPQPVRLPPVAQDIGFELQRRTDEHQIIIDFPPEFPIGSRPALDQTGISAISWTTRSNIPPRVAWSSSGERSARGCAHQYRRSGGRHFPRRLDPAF
jgi:hypothetical protein